MRDSNMPPLTGFMVYSMSRFYKHGNPTGFVLVSYLMNLFGRKMFIDKLNLQWIEKPNGF